MKSSSTSLLVIGGGAAGFAAALEAATAGSRVTLLEKTAQIGGSSAMSGGCRAGKSCGGEAGMISFRESLIPSLVHRRPTSGFSLPTYPTSPNSSTCP